MKKRTREKVALLVFALLIVLGGSVLLRYFETGRSLNQAATVVDDAFGQMAGYTALVFDGTYNPLDSLRPTRISITGQEEEGQNEPASIGEMVLDKLSGLPLALRERPVYASDVRTSYEEKGAGVVTLNLGDLARYRTPCILMAGQRALGVVSIDYFATSERIGALQEEMKAQGAQSFICLTPRLSCLATTEGFNVVIVTDDDQAIPGDTLTMGSTHIIYAPEQEEVGVVLLTNLNVPTSKVYASL